MLLNLIIFSFIMAFIIAKLEINIEGIHGWAQNLPTWRIRNRLTKFLYGEQPFTGYHFWFAIMGIAFLQFPFFVGMQFSLSLELQTLAVFVWGVVIEDFFWFVLNPDFGFKKFNRFHIPWHKWMGFLPRFYYMYFVSGFALVILSYLV